MLGRKEGKKNEKERERETGRQTETVGGRDREGRREINFSPKHRNPVTKQPVRWHKLAPFSACTWHMYCTCRHM